jgi:hypothetical protein
VAAAYGAARIGKPQSPWAHWRLTHRRLGKQAKAQERFRPDRRTERLKEAFRDAVGGTPAAVYEAKLAERARRGAAPSLSKATAEPSRRPEGVSVEARKHGADPPGAAKPQGDAGGEKSIAFPNSTRQSPASPRRTPIQTSSTTSDWPTPSRQPKSRPNPASDL